MIDTVVNWLSRNWKSLVIVVAAVWCTMLLTGSCHQRVLRAVDQKTEILKTENIMLQDRLLQRESEIGILNGRVLEYRDTVDMLEGENNRLVVDLNRIERERRDLISTIESLPADSSYEFLQQVAYPLEGEGEFAFNDKQVSAIHMTYVESKFITEISHNQQERLANLEEQILVRDSISFMQTSMIVLKDEQLGMKDEIIDNKDQEIEAKDRVIRKQKRGGTFWKITTAVASAVAAALLISG